jgi:hypothetical protein
MLLPPRNSDTPPRHGVLLSVCWSCWVVLVGCSSSHPHRQAPPFTASTFGGSLALERYNNTAMAGVGRQTLLTTLAVSLPGTELFSAQITGTLSPLQAQPGGSTVSWWTFVCTFQNVDIAFVRVDGHMVCQHGAYNQTSTGALDRGRFHLLEKQADLAIQADIYHTRASTEAVVAELRWCPQGETSQCELLPPGALGPALPEPDRRRREMQRGLAQGWGSWLHRDALSVVLLPDAAVITLMLCRISTGACLREANIDGNGGGDETDLSHPVRVGSHAIDHSYSQMYVWKALTKLNVSIEYSVTSVGKSPSPLPPPGRARRELDLLVTPVVRDRATQLALSDFAIAVTGSFAWGRVGSVSTDAASRTIRLRGHGLMPVELMATAPALARTLRGVVPPGLLAGERCQFGSKACGAQTCTQNAAANISCASGVCSTPAGRPWAAGRCTKPQTLPHLALRLGDGPVGISTHTSTSSVGGMTRASTLKDIQARVAAAALKQRMHESRFGANHSALAQALGAAVSWRNIFVPAETGPVIPTTYGFSWIDVGPASNDWRYIQFGWDNIFNSFTAGVLGYRDAAYSNLIGIIKAKSFDGFVPNHAAGGAISSHSEPAVGGKVLLELYKRFGDQWIVELLIDDLVDWSDWQWTHRRVVGPDGGPCAEPGFITIGDSYVACSTNPSTASNCPGGGESGLDQSPLWDCPGADPAGRAGNCSSFTYRNPKSSPGVLQLADMQSTSLFVLDAESIAELAIAINRTGSVSRLRDRASQMRTQLRKAWNPTTGSFGDIFPATGAFSEKLTPTAFYPLFARAASDQQASTMVSRHLLNASEFCISANYSQDADSSCFWGLPSIAANAPQFMQPLSYVYWRGLSWGPMTMLTWWALDTHRHVPAIKAARTMLARQKTDMMLWHWHAHRHICENYSPFHPDSKRNPGTNNGGQSNDECTGWQFYTWGALNGLVTVLEAQEHRTAAATQTGAVVDLVPAQAPQLASIVAAHPAGTTYRFAEGLFRLPLEGIPAKDGDVFEGVTSCSPTQPPMPDSSVLGGGTAWQQPTTEVRKMCESKGVKPTVLSGAVVLTNATRYSGPMTSQPVWVVTGLTQLDSGQHGACCTASAQQGCLGQVRPACGFRNELYLGDKLFRRASSLENVSSMSFFIEYSTPNPKGEMYKLSAGKLYFSADSKDSSPPSVELSLLRSVFSSSGWVMIHNKSQARGASGVRVSNLVVEKIASYAQAAAVETTCSPEDANASVPDCGWQISGVEVRFSHGRGINNHNGASVVNSSAHHCGQLGFGGSSGVVSGCEIAWNNQAFFATGWEAGGGKWVNHLGHLEISQCWVHDNFGDGLWADVASVDIKYSRNIIVNNSGAGISHEISYAAVMEGNYASSNGYGFQVWLWSGQLQIQNSRDIIVRNNTVVVRSGAANGIVIVQQNRSCIGCWPAGSSYPSLPPMPAQNVTVTKNTVSECAPLAEGSVPHTSART